MPMYYPDIESVRARCATMAQHKGEKKYTGIIPSTEQELVVARRQLAEYIRKVWKDEIWAMEVELAVTKENYEEKMQEMVRNKVLMGGKNE